jgi:hypothetical protein
MRLAGAEREMEPVTESQTATSSAVNALPLIGVCLALRVRPKYRVHRRYVEAIVDAISAYVDPWVDAAPCVQISAAEGGGRSASDVGGNGSGAYDRSCTDIGGEHDGTGGQGSCGSVKRCACSSFKDRLVFVMNGDDTDVEWKGKGINRKPICRAAARGCRPVWQTLIVDDTWTTYAHNPSHALPVPT